jgi:hypothetical protein
MHSSDRARAPFRATAPSATITPGGAFELALEKWLAAAISSGSGLRLPADALDHVAINTCRAAAHRVDDLAEQLPRAPDKRRPCASSSAPGPRYEHQPAQGCPVRGRRASALTERAAPGMRHLLRDRESAATRFPTIEPAVRAAQAASSWRGAAGGASAKAGGRAARGERRTDLARMAGGRGRRIGLERRGKGAARPGKAVSSSQRARASSAQGLVMRRAKRRGGNLPRSGNIFFLHIRTGGFCGAVAAAEPRGGSRMRRGLLGGGGRGGAARRAHAGERAQGLIRPLRARGGAASSAARGACGSKHTTRSSNFD